MASDMGIEGEKLLKIGKWLIRMIDCCTATVIRKQLHGHVFMSLGYSRCVIYMSVIKPRDTFKPPAADSTDLMLSKKQILMHKLEMQFNPLLSSSIRISHS